MLIQLGEIDLPHTKEDHLVQWYNGTISRYYVYVGINFVSLSSSSISSRCCHVTCIYTEYTAFYGLIIIIFFFLVDNILLFVHFGFWG